MSKDTLKIASLNLRTIKIPYFATGLIMLLTGIQTIVKLILAMNGVDLSEYAEVSIANYLWLICLLSAIIIPIKNFQRIINLGGRRTNFLTGSLITYGVLAACISLINIAYYYTIDTFLDSTHYFLSSMNVIRVFGWGVNGPVIAFIQQFAFLFLVCAVTHTLTSMQDKWYGWITDVIIIAILAVFIPIAPLRTILLHFFNLIIFQPNAFLQIAVCLLLALFIYGFNKSIYDRKAI